MKRSLGVVQALELVLYHAHYHPWVITMPMILIKKLKLIFFVKHLIM